VAIDKIVNFENEADFHETVTSDGWPIIRRLLESVRVKMGNDVLTTRVESEPDVMKLALKRAEFEGATRMIREFEALIKAEQTRYEVAEGIRKVKNRST
jgi:hypothetical protein